MTEETTTKAPKAPRKAAQTTTAPGSFSAPAVASELITEFRSGFPNKVKSTLRNLSASKAAAVTAYVAASLTRGEQPGFAALLEEDI